MSTKTAGGNAISHSIPNATYTRQQIATFIATSADNAISYAISRNPTTVYKYIRQNYGTAYANLKSGAEATTPNMEGMFNFLLRQYHNLQPSQQAHFIATLLQSLPTAPQLQNWTTPIN